MRGQDFEAVRRDLLPLVELLTVEEHRAVLGGAGWTPPEAYRWIRYEDQDPVGQLLRAGERLEALWRRRPARLHQEFAVREREMLAAARAVAGGLGYS